MLKLWKRARGHFVTLFEIGVHLITCISDHIKYVGHLQYVTSNQKSEFYSTCRYDLDEGKTANYCMHGFSPTVTIS